MKHLFLMCLLFYVNIHTTQSEIINQRVTVGKDAILLCKHEGKVRWSKDRDGTRVAILAAEKDGETRKLFSDPRMRYSVLDDLSLHIESVSPSDSGIYYCNAAPTVNLIVTEPEIFNRSVTVGKDVYLVCNHEGNVRWSKDRDGKRVHIHTAEKDEETLKLISFPHKRYIVLYDLSLHIINVSLSDSGIYYCNAAPTVNLIVKEPDSTTSNDRQTEATTPTPERTTSSYSQPGATTPTPGISTNTTQPTQSNSSISEFTSTKGFSHSQPEGTTPSQDSSAKKYFKSFCLKEIK